jgi:RF-1 domain
MNDSDQTLGRAATVEHPAALDPAVLASQCTTRMTRRSGPGGQHRNKVETAVEVIHGPTGLRAQASERRSQGENRAVALKRLRLELAISIRRMIDLGQAGASYAPTPLWLNRCRRGRIVVNRDHDEFPALLAEALDVLRAGAFDPRPAALALACSPSQLIKLIKEEPRALRSINDERRKMGQRPLL